jgi:heme exporter protein D
VGVQQPKDYFDRVFSKPRPLWLSIVVSLLLLVLPLAAACLDGIWDDFFLQGDWRVFMLPSSLIAYVWLISPVIERRGVESHKAILSVLRVEQNELDRILQSVRIKPWWLSGRQSWLV